MKLLVLEEKSVFERHAPKELFSACEVTVMSPYSTAAEVAKVCGDAELLLTSPVIRIGRDMIAALPRLRLIQTEGVGFEGIDLEAAKEGGIYVCNCRGVNALAVAEHTVMLMLCCLRDVVNGNEDVLEGRQNEKKVGYMKNGSLRELGDCTVGFIGYGAIGREAARLARAFGARTLYYKPVPGDAEYAEYCPLEELLAISDIVSLNLPLTGETENMADRRFFGKMKKGAYLINTARGGLVNSADLIDAIASGQLAGAGLDVLDHEPVQKDHILLTAPEEVRRKIIFSPHIAGVSASAFRRTYEIVMENVLAVKQGGRPVNIVNGL